MKLRHEVCVREREREREIINVKRDREGMRKIEWERERHIETNKIYPNEKRENGCVREREKE